MLTARGADGSEERFRRLPGAARHIPLATRQGRQDARSGRGPVASREAHPRPSYARGGASPLRQVALRRDRAPVPLQPAPR
jgi:hypothetical protein